MKRTGRTRLTAATALLLALGGLGAHGAEAADTTTTFTLSGDGLSISAPAAATLSASTAIGTASLSAQLGNVTVNDNRGALLGSWTATVSSTDFTTTAELSSNVIAKANGSYISGVATISGTVVPTGTVGAVALDQSRTAMSATGSTGSNSVTWNPTIAVSVPNNVVAGQYTGTITHSVA